MESVIPEKPEKLSEKDKQIAAAKRTLGRGEYSPEAQEAILDSLRYGKKPVSLFPPEVGAERQKAKRQIRLDKQSRLKELRSGIRAAIVLRNKRVTDSAGEEVAVYPPGSEDRAELDAQIDAMKRERDELRGKAKLGLEVADEHGLVVGEKYISPAGEFAGKTFIYRGNGKFEPVAD